MNWIDEANKKLEEQRANFQESLDSGEAAKRGMGAGGKIGGSRKGLINGGLAAKESGQLLAAQIKGGKTTGKMHVESGHLEKVRKPKKAGDASRKKVKCIHCGKEAATYNHARWHGDNCKTLKQ
tara:strand:- start:37 stop:408 length:372 start_codon:yes stop_codon:yes gene_type:complete